jgi:7,8-dihydroneopterin aldolase/epimerase/oxygenase
MTDRIVLRDIEAEAMVGVFEWERVARRALRIDLELACDLAAAAASDRLEDTVDYAALTARVRERCAASSYRLIEALAGDIASACLEDPRVASVGVTVRKPGAVAGVGEISVELHRSR